MNKVRIIVYSHSYTKELLDNDKTHHDSTVIHKTRCTHEIYTIQNWHDFDDFHLHVKQTRFICMSSKQSVRKRPSEMRTLKFKTNSSCIFVSYIAIHKIKSCNFSVICLFICNVTNFFVVDLHLSAISSTFNWTKLSFSAHVCRIGLQSNQMNSLETCEFCFPFIWAHLESSCSIQRSQTKPHGTNWNTDIQAM